MPSTLDLKVMDEVITVSDRSFLTTRRLARERESSVISGAALFAALKVAQTLDNAKTIVVILPDTGRSYLNKIYNDDWMAEYGFIEVGQTRISVDELLRSKSKRIRSLVYVTPRDNLSKAIRLMKKYGVSHLPVLRRQVPVGSVSEGPLMKKLNSKSVSVDAKVEDAMGEPFPVVRMGDMILDPLNHMKDESAIVVVDGPKAIGIITTIDVISYLARK